MLTLKRHQHARVNIRFVKLAVPSRHRVPKLSLLFPSLPPPRELPDQTRHTPDVVSLQAFRNSRIIRAIAILFFALASTPTGALTSLSCTNCRVSRCTLPPVSITNGCHLVPYLRRLHACAYPPAASGYRARMMRPRHVTGRRTGHSHVNDKFRTIREQFDVTSLAMTSFAVQSRLG